MSDKRTSDLAVRHRPGRGREDERDLCSPLSPSSSNGSIHGFRERIFAEAAHSDLPGLIFTLVWDYGDPADVALDER